MFPATAKDDSTNSLKNPAHDLNSAANQAGRKVRSMYNAASDEIAHASEYMTAEIRSNPVRSSMLALGAGVLLGALLRR